MTDPRPYKPTRADLAKFIKDHRTLIAIEGIFDIVPGEVISNNISAEEASIDANTAIAKANQAISGTVSNEIKAKSNGVLIWLSII